LFIQEKSIMERSWWVRLTGMAYTMGGALWLVLALAMGALYGGDPPSDAAAFIPSQILWIISQGLLLFGFFGLFVGRAVGDSLFGKLAFGLGVLGHLLFVVAEIHSLASRTISDLVAVAALVSAIGILLTGIAVLRAAQWHGWARWLPLLTGLYPWLFMFPLIAITGDANIFAIGGWGLVRMVLGLAIRHQTSTMPTATPVAAVLPAQNRL
jgi:hypothetical protein